ncbi:hypothetical protein D3C75_1384960 [compost metagenome]
MGEAEVERIGFPLAPDDRIRVDDNQISARITFFHPSEELRAVIRRIVIDHDDLIAVGRVIEGK